MTNEIGIRQATVGDTAELLKIYDYYVKNTAITFEYDTPSNEEFSGRIASISGKYPYILAERDGEILGYSYISSFVGRMAYDCSAETTIYLKPEIRRCGVGRRLYKAIEDIAKKQGVLNLYACIGYPNGEDDEYLTRNSAEFHEHMGYHLVGTFTKCGNKFGRWYDMIWMEKMIGVHDGSSIPPIKTIDQIISEIDFDNY